jgi:GNAT superfamily N-acetyltransferase
MESVNAPRLLNSDDLTSNFDCGIEELNSWLHLRAKANHLSGASRTYVAMNGENIAAFYCLAAGSIEHESATGAVRRNMPNPIPTLVIGRLAVDVHFQGQGLGVALLQHAIETSLHIAKSAGVRALVVHAKNKRAAEFYKRQQFVPSTLNEFILMMRLQK